MTIYVLTDGEYSDYHIIGAFTDKSLAETTAELMRRGDTLPCIEKYEANVVPDHPPNHFAFRIVMAQDGAHTGERIPHDDIRPDAAQHDWTVGRGYQQNGKMTFCMWATDEKHAVKIANEHRVQLIAMNNWPQKGEPTWKPRP